MRSDHFLRFKDSGGALLIVERAIAAEFGYTTSQEEIPTVTLEEMRNRQRNVNLARAEHRKAKASRRANANIAVAVMPVGSPTVGRDDNLQATTRTETGGSDVEGNGPVLHVQADEARREGRDVHDEGVVRPGNIGGDGNNSGEWGSDTDPDAIAIPQLVALFTGGQEGLNDNQTVVNGS